MTDKKTPIGKNQMIANNVRLFGKFITQKNMYKFDSQPKGYKLQTKENCRIFISKR